MPAQCYGISLFRFLNTSLLDSIFGDGRSSLNPVNDPYSVHISANFSTEGFSGCGIMNCSGYSEANVLVYVLVPFVMHEMSYLLARA